MVRKKGTKCSDRRGAPWWFWQLLSSRDPALGCVNRPPAAPMSADVWDHTQADKYMCGSALPWSQAQA